MLLLKGAVVYSPRSEGRGDILIAGGRIERVAIGEGLELPDSCASVVDVTGLSAVPGFIDGHVHITGGGGEGGYATRTPELLLSDAVRGGVTTVVGCLGTDGVTRSLAGLLAKARGLDEEGITRLHVHRLLRGARPDADRQHRARPAADRQGDRRRRGGVVRSPLHAADLRGVRAHRGRGAARRHPVGQGRRRERAHGGRPARPRNAARESSTETEIPASQFLPTHINRNPRCSTRASPTRRRAASWTSPRPPSRRSSRRAR